MEDAERSALKSEVMQALGSRMTEGLSQRHSSRPSGGGLLNKKSNDKLSQSTILHHSAVPEIMLILFQSYDYNSFECHEGIPGIHHTSSGTCAHVS
jgi:hypothetical protein